MEYHDVKRVASRASDHPALEGLARVGYATSGLLHLLIGWITLQVAYGGGGKNADQSGALASLAGNGLGKVLLWVSVVGFLGLAVWQLADAVVGHPGDDKDAWGGRAKAVGKAVVYLALAYSAFRFATGKATNGRSQSVDFTAKLLEKPGGRTLVVIIGLGVVGVGLYHVYKGWKMKFLQDLKDHPGMWATRAGRFGYVAKGVALVIVGFLFVTAGINKQPQEASGLDGALKSLRDQPFGTALLILMAIGFAAFGVYSFSRAKHAKV
ncbi:hypothetical protein BJ986_000226 [Phycicoccus badiiscoriae]|uniref:DUF1206 domain-containing protein n=1 Tax=Pedococcus badiiscoriae TaxID=642776 RepID=A0A852WA85_9MICO|nr:DUF1206 domain-containing protein [Pedococcus badiiscoriae]NYG05739.1 hypothetical protein [Pedococcus badiiscoriae]